MKRFLLLFTAVLGFLLGCQLRAQTAAPVQVLKGPDERFKTDILVVVAHPDDEGGVTPYLARAIYDEHKRVAVVFATRGGSGGNDYSREHGPALADIREQEARQACAKMGITNVWFMEGKDTASQNVLNSLANWGHGANLEALVRIVRLTRPEVVITWLPGAFIGENHGDHQAAGVLATEAFDVANDPTAFPSQVAGATKRLEVYLENLTPWQPKKLYFFSDADDQKQFAGTGPAYSAREISPSQKKPYWRLAMDAATPHLTQFPAEIHQLTAMTDEEIMKFMDDPQHSWWTEPMTLILGKSAIPTPSTAPVFPGEKVIEIKAPALIADRMPSHVQDVQMKLAGVWAFYGRFYALHHLDDSEHFPIRLPQIAIKQEEVLRIPIVIERSMGASREIELKVSTPKGWETTRGVGKFLLPDEPKTFLFVEIQTPKLSHEELKSMKQQAVSIVAESGGKQVGQAGIEVLLKASALPQE